MDKLIKEIHKVRQELPGWRRIKLKETQTRTIIINPILSALYWNVLDPNEVQEEYPTIDGKFVDYALALNKRPVLLIEAKPLGDSLDDVKAITQVVGYANNDGITWCILTNGIKWRVYRSMEKCAAPDKLLFEVDLDPDNEEGMTAEEIAARMWRFSRDRMIAGELDALGEQTFTDGKVRKALFAIMAEPPNTLLKLLRNSIGDEKLAPKRIKESLLRIASSGDEDELFFVSAPEEGLSNEDQESPQQPGGLTIKTKKRAKKGESPYDEKHHLAGIPQEALSLFESIDRLCMSLMPSGVSRRFLAKSINYDFGGICFCSIHMLRGSLKIWLPLKYSRIENPPPFVRDVSNIGHWGVGDLEMRITNPAELEKAKELIRHSFETVKA